MDTQEVTKILIRALSNDLLLFTAHNPKEDAEIVKAARDELSRRGVALAH